MTAGTISFKHLLSNITLQQYKRNRSTDTRKSHGKSGKSGHRKTSFERAHFIAWDGEGISDVNRKPKKVYDETGNLIETVEYQSYALLMNNEGIVVRDIWGISTNECLSTLLSATDDKKAIHVCFGASYDVNMMLHGTFRDIPEADLRELQKGNTIDYGKYQLSYRPHKSFEIREYMSIHEKYKWNPKTKRREGWYKNSITLWDVFSFFQSSFVEALSKYFVRGNQLPATKEKYERIIEKIAEGKTRRGTFTEEELQTFVEPYCKLEVDALEELMQLLHSYLQEADMKVSRWDGAGACAAALLKKYKVKPHISEANIPAPVIEAAEYAFFGGRIEALQYGNYEGNVYHADINSAYPSAMATLPSLAEGEWVHIVYPLLMQHVSYMPPVSVFLVSWHMDSNAIIAPFPWRDSIGNVYFPTSGKAWIWKPELDMAISEFSKGKYKCKLHIHESWSFHPSTDVKPFSFIPEMYESRRQDVIAKRGVEKVKKLALNSLYGKTAQSVGYNRVKRSKPPYHNLVDAGMTTSITRAKMMYAAMQNPESVIMLATDGIYSTKPIVVPGMDSADKLLGEWEVSIHEYITIVASGVYWYKTESEDENAYSRGFNKYTIMRDMVLNAWNRGVTELDCDTTRFVGLGSAVGLNDFDLWCTWRTVKRVLGLNVDKVKKRREKKSGINPATGLVRTYSASYRGLDHLGDTFPFPYDNAATAFMMSSKYKFVWDSPDAFDSFDGVRMREYLEEVANTRS